MPSVDAARMGERTEVLSAASGMPTPEGRVAGDRAMEEFSAYVQDQIEDPAPGTGRRPAARARGGRGGRRPPRRRRARRHGRPAPVRRATRPPATSSAASSTACCEHPDHWPRCGPTAARAVGASRRACATTRPSGSRRASRTSTRSRGRLAPRRGPARGAAPHRGQRRPRPRADPHRFDVTRTDAATCRSAGACTTAWAPPGPPRGAVPSTRCSTASRASGRRGAVAVDGLHAAPHPRAPRARRHPA